MNAAEMPHEDRVGWVMSGEARDKTKVIAPRRRTLLVQRGKRPAVRPKHVFDSPVTARTQSGKRVML